jgi:hypothetical protein
MDSNIEIEESGTLIPVAPGFWLAPLKSSKPEMMRFVMVPYPGLYLVVNHDNTYSLLHFKEFVAENQ